MVVMLTCFYQPHGGYVYAGDSEAPVICNMIAGEVPVQDRGLIRAPGMRLNNYRTRFQSGDHSIVGQNHHVVGKDMCVWGFYRYNNDNSKNYTFPVRRLGVHRDDLMIIG
jgi:hypothetical protein